MIRALLIKPPRWPATSLAPRVSSAASMGMVPAPQKGAGRTAERRPFEISANDRRFQRSLRIAADETQEKEGE